MNKLTLFTILGRYFIQIYNLQYCKKTKNSYENIFI